MYNFINTNVIKKKKVWKSSKMSHLNFWILAFSINFCPIKSDRSGNTVWLNSSGIQKLTKVIILGINETFSMIFKHHGVLILEMIYVWIFRAKIVPWKTNVSCHFGRWHLQTSFQSIVWHLKKWGDHLDYLSTITCYLSGDDLDFYVCGQ